MAKKNTIAGIFGLAGSLSLILTACLLVNFTYLIICSMLVGTSLLVFTLFVFYIKNYRHTREINISYATVTTYTTILSLMVFIVFTIQNTGTNCNNIVRNCTRYIFVSIFGFVSALCFLVTSVLMFNILEII
ncbi:conserved membrane protein, unknown function [Hepatocystis sp. ex Piliocolobus tephrosceles]|nr:conserved membrane protein, unknown function [Hepatocystis sp. ex Piliocolobus tephrosceles]